MHPEHRYHVSPRRPDPQSTIDACTEPKTRRLERLAWLTAGLADLCTCVRVRAERKRMRSADMSLSQPVVPGRSLRARDGDPGGLQAWRHQRGPHVARFIVARLATYATTAFSIAIPAFGGELSLPNYQRPDGAITVRLNSDTVDPYFAAKAILSAQDARVDARTVALKWIDWAMPRQRSDGSFDRFCVRPGETVACAPADADDAAIAVWMELLARYAPSTGMPPKWRESLDRAASHLERLYDPDKGVYQISKSLPVALLMDNTEIYSSMTRLGTYYASTGDTTHATMWRARAALLGRAIIRVFWTENGQYQPSTQPLKGDEFYPTRVAQIFPMLAGIPTPQQSDATLYEQWMKRNRQMWLALPSHDFPWGLVALASQRIGDDPAIACWHAHAAPYRHGAHWNVLEEALFVSFESQLSDPLAPAPSC